MTIALRFSCFANISTRIFVRKLTKPPEPISMSGNILTNSIFPNTAFIHSHSDQKRRVATSIATRLF